MSEKISEIVEKIKGLSLVEASELKKALETEFGVFCFSTSYDGCRCSCCRCCC